MLFLFFQTVNARSTNRWWVEAVIHKWLRPKWNNSWGVHPRWFYGKHFGVPVSSLDVLQWTEARCQAASCKLVLNWWMKRWQEKHRLTALFWVLTSPLWCAKSVLYGRSFCIGEPSSHSRLIKPPWSNECWSLTACISGCSRGPPPKENPATPSTIQGKFHFLGCETI